MGERVRPGRRWSRPCGQHSGLRWQTGSSISTLIPQTLNAPLSPNAFVRGHYAESQLAGLPPQTALVLGTPLPRPRNRLINCLFAGKKPTILKLAIGSCSATARADPVVPKSLPAAAVFVHWLLLVEIFQLHRVFDKGIHSRTGYQMRPHNTHTIGDYIFRRRFRGWGMNCRRYLTARFILTVPVSGIVSMITEYSLSGVRLPLIGAFPLLLFPASQNRSRNSGFETNDRERTKVCFKKKNKPILPTGEP